MADEETPKTDKPADESAPAIDTGFVDAAAGVATDEEAPIKLQQTVEIKDVGPCKKHVKVTVDRGAIDQRFNERFTELVQAQVKKFGDGGREVAFRVAVKGGKVTLTAK